MADASLIMWSIGQIAERDGVSKPAISKQIKKLLAAKPLTPVDLDGQGRVQRISLAHYDDYRQRHVNPAKATAPLRAIDGDGEAGASDKTDAPGRSKGAADSFDEARRQSEWLKVGRERIRHQEEIGQLVRVDMLGEAHRTVGGEIKTVVSRLQNRADEIAHAVSKEGVHGARVVLRRIAFELGNEIADKLGEIAVAAPATDPLIEVDEG
jgi:hypothetical protein